LANRPVSAYADTIRFDIRNFHYRDRENPTLAPSHTKGPSTWLKMLLVT